MVSNKPRGQQRAIAAADAGRWSSKPAGLKDETRGWGARLPPYSETTNHEETLGLGLAFCGRDFNATSTCCSAPRISSFKLVASSHPDDRHGWRLILGTTAGTLVVLEWPKHPPSLERPPKPKVHFVAVSALAVPITAIVLLESPFSEVACTSRVLILAWQPADSLLTLWTIDDGRCLARMDDMLNQRYQPTSRAKLSSFAEAIEGLYNSTVAPLLHALKSRFILMEQHTCGAPIACIDIGLRRVVALLALPNPDNDNTSTIMPHVYLHDGQSYPHEVAITVFALINSAELVRWDLTDTILRHLSRTELVGTAAVGNPAEVSSTPRQELHPTNSWNIWEGFKQLIINEHRSSPEQDEGLQQKLTSHIILRLQVVYENHVLVQIRNEVVLFQFCNSTSTMSVDDYATLHTTSSSLPWIQIDNRIVLVPYRDGTSCMISVDCVKHKIHRTLMPLALHNKVVFQGVTINHPIPSIFVFYANQRRSRLQSTYLEFKLPPLTALTRCMSLPENASKLKSNECHQHGSEDDSQIKPYHRTLLRLKNAWAISDFEALCSRQYSVAPLGSEFCMVDWTFEDIIYTKCTPTAKLLNPSVESNLPARLKTCPTTVPPGKVSNKGDLSPQRISSPSVSSLSETSEPQICHSRSRRQLAGRTSDLRSAACYQSPIFSAHPNQGEDSDPHQSLETTITALGDWALERTALPTGLRTGVPGTKDDGVWRSHRRCTRRVSRARVCVVHWTGHGYLLGGTDNGTLLVWRLTTLELIAEEQALMHYRICRFVPVSICAHTSLGETTPIPPANGCYDLSLFVDASKVLVGDVAGSTALVTFDADKAIVKSFRLDHMPCMFRHAINSAFYAPWDSKLHIVDHLGRFSTFALPFGCLERSFSDNLARKLRTRWLAQVCFLSRRGNPANGRATSWRVIFEQIGLQHTPLAILFAVCNSIDSVKCMNVASSTLAKLGQVWTSSRGPQHLAPVYLPTSSGIVDTLGLRGGGKPTLESLKATAVLQSLLYPWCAAKLSQCPAIVTPVDLQEDPLISPAQSSVLGHVSIQPLYQLVPVTSCLVGPGGCLTYMLGRSRSIQKLGRIASPYTLYLQVLISDMIFTSCFGNEIDVPLVVQNAKDVRHQLTTRLVRKLCAMERPWSAPASSLIWLSAYLACFPDSSSIRESAHHFLRHLSLRLTRCTYSVESLVSREAEIEHRNLQTTMALAEGIVRQYGQTRNALARNSGVDFSPDDTSAISDEIVCATPRMEIDRNPQMGRSESLSFLVGESKRANTRLVRKPIAFFRPMLDLSAIDRHKIPILSRHDFWGCRITSLGEAAVICLTAIVTASHIGRARAASSTSGRSRAASGNLESCVNSPTTPPSSSAPDSPLDLFLFPKRSPVLALDNAQNIVVESVLRILAKPSTFLRISPASKAPLLPPLTANHKTKLAIKAADFGSMDVATELSSSRKKRYETLQEVLCVPLEDVSKLASDEVSAYKMVLILEMFGSNMPGWIPIVMSQAVYEGCGSPTSEQAQRACDLDESLAKSAIVPGSLAWPSSMISEESCRNFREMACLVIGILLGYTAEALFSHLAVASLSHWLNKLPRSTMSVMTLALEVGDLPLNIPLAILRVLSSVATQADVTYEMARVIVELIILKLLDPCTPKFKREMVLPVTNLIYEMIRAVPAMALHRDSQRLALGCADGSIIIYHLRTASTLRSLTGHLGPATAVAFGDEGSKVVSFSPSESSVRIWNLDRQGNGAASILSTFGGAITKARYQSKTLLLTPRPRIDPKVDHLSSLIPRFRLSRSPSGDWQLKE